MQGVDPYDVVSLFSFTTFTLLLILGASTTVARAIRYTRAGEALPTLLIRDLIWQAGLGVDFVLLLGARLFVSLGIIQPLSGNLLWAVITGGLAVVAVGAYAYFEVFVIEKGDKSKGAEIGEEARRKARH